jgi:YesN/AraC family two-component response regulator
MGMFDQNSNDGELTPEEALVAVCGEGKKYATPAELAKAKLHADNHISVLEAELADLRKKGDSSAEVQELLKALREGKLPQQQAQTQDQGADKQEVDVDKLLEEKLNNRLNAQSAKENQSKVIGHFQTQYGTKAGDMFTKLASELEMDKQELEQMCASKPGAVIKLAGQLLGGAEQHNTAATLTGDKGQRNALNLGGEMPTTKSELLKKAEAEKWPRDKKYAALNREMSRATREGRLDAWNR